MRLWDTIKSKISQYPQTLSAHRIVLQCDLQIMPGIRLLHLRNLIRSPRRNHMSTPHQVRQYWSEAFPKLVSYNRFVTWMPCCMLLLCCYLKTCFGADTGISFVDATSLKVCHPPRIGSHRVFKGIAARGKTSVDWIYGLKLHLAVNECGALLNITVTPGNTDDRKPEPEESTDAVK